MAENKHGISFGGPWRYGCQPGITSGPAFTDLG
jgi:hypothetical protein